MLYMADSSWVIKTKAALRAIKKGEEQMVSFKLLVEKKKKTVGGLPSVASHRVGHD